MYTTTNKSYAILLVITTVIGLLFSLFFLIQTWRYREPVTKSLQSVVVQTSLVLVTTDQGLDVIDQVVKTVYTSTVFLDTTANELAQTAQDTNQFIGSAGVFLGENLINTITNTQVAIDSSQASAVVIDNLLTTLSRIPLIGINYNPSKPLNVTLGEVSASLDPLQISLIGFQKSLETTQANIQDFEQQIAVLDQTMVTITKNLEDTQVVLDEYREQLHSLQTWMNNAQISLPRWINTLAWLLTFFIIWLVLIQVGLLLQAINVLSVHEAQPTVIDDV